MAGLLDRLVCRLAGHDWYTPTTARKDTFCLRCGAKEGEEQ